MQAQAPKNPTTYKVGPKTSGKWSYNPYKWPYKWAPEVITPNYLWSYNPILIPDRGTPTDYTPKKNERVPKKGPFQKENVQYLPTINFQGILSSNHQFSGDIIFQPSIFRGYYLPTINFQGILSSNHQFSGDIIFQPSIFRWYYLPTINFQGICQFSM